MLGLEAKQRTVTIDRAQPWLPDEKRQQSTIIKLHNVSDKSRMQSAGREKGDLSLQGSKIYIAKIV